MQRKQFYRFQIHTFHRFFITIQYTFTLDGEYIYHMRSELHNTYTYILVHPYVERMLAVCSLGLILSVYEYTFYNTDIYFSSLRCIANARTCTHHTIVRCTCRIDVIYNYM